MPYSEITTLLISVERLESQNHPYPFFAVCSYGCSASNRSSALIVD